MTRGEYADNCVTRQEHADTWRYSVVVVGLAGVLGLFAFAVASDESLGRLLATAGVPLGIFGLLVAFGLHLRDRESPGHVRTVAAIGVTAAAGYVALAGWFYTFVDQEHAILGSTEAFYLAYGAASIGCAFGVVAGHYYVRQREQARRLRAANDELRSQNERLDEFASIISHDLRNPLAVARGYVELAAETGNTNHLDDIAACHDRIEGLVDQVLALAKMERDPDDVGSVQVAGVATDAFETVDSADAELVVEVAESVQVERGDLRQVLENCYRNAVEHAGPSPTIKVTCLDDHAGFAVEDDGPGIPARDRETVFERGVTNGDGTGLGLAIVDEVAETYGWEVSIAEGREGGARFEFYTGERDDGTASNADEPSPDDVPEDAATAATADVARGVR